MGEGGGKVRSEVRGGGGGGVWCVGGCWQLKRATY